MDLEEYNNRDKLKIYSFYNIKNIFELICPIKSYQSKTYE